LSKYTNWFTLLFVRYFIKNYFCKCPRWCGTEIIMKQITFVCFIIALITNNPVWARGGGHYGGWGGQHHGGWGHHYGGNYYGGIGLGLGLGYGLGYGSGYGGSYYSPYYGGYPPAVVAVPVTPPVYIQQTPPQPTAQQYPSGYWYYCNNPQGYYPYIKQCSSAWQPVNPTHPAPR
jgi:hypothetical protein